MKDQFTLDYTPWLRSTTLIKDIILDDLLDDSITRNKKHLNGRYSRDSKE